ncbi:MAG: DUF2752 domain-containing protein [Actinomycetota bacterium]
MATRAHLLGRARPVLASAPLVVLALATMISPTDDGATVCPFALLTGTACPGCGMTRAIAWIIRADLGRGVAYHPLAPLFIVGALTAAIWWGGHRLKGWHRPDPRLVNNVLIGVGVLLIVVWVIRLMTGTLPPIGASFLGLQLMKS